MTNIITFQNNDFLAFVVSACFELNIEYSPATYSLPTIYHTSSAFECQRSCQVSISPHTQRKTAF